MGFLYFLFPRAGQPDRHGPFEQGGRMPELSGLLAARTRLRPGGGRGHREYRGQHLRRSGFGRYGQDVERALRQDRAAANLQLAEQRQSHHLDQYAARQPDSRLEDLQPLARHVRGCRGGQFRRTHRAEALPRRDRHRQGEARRGDGFVRSDPGNILVPRCRRRGSYGGDHPTQLYADQGGRLADHKTGTQTHRRRPCATASVGKEIGGSTSPPISVYHGLPSVLKSGNEECDFTLWTVCKSYVRVM